MDLQIDLKKYKKTWNDSYLGRCTARRGFRNTKNLENRSYGEEVMEENRRKEKWVLKREGDRE